MGGQFMTQVYAVLVTIAWCGIGSFVIYKIVDVIEEKYPELAAKVSCIHTGFFYTSFNILPDSYMKKVSLPTNDGCEIG